MKLKKFKDWKVFYKIMALALLILSTIIAVFFLFLIPMISTTLYHDKEQNVKHTVEVAYNVLNNHYQMVKDGILTEQEAKQQASNMLRELRYNENEYFWINDYSPKMIMHPMNEKLNGEDLSDYKDPNGVLIFKKSAEIAKREGEGFIEYSWAKPGFSEPVPKISYVKGLREWGWIVGSGIYVDDVEADLAAIRLNIIIILLVASVIAIIAGLFVAKKISDPVNKLKEAAGEIADGKSDVTVNINTQDEFGELGKTFDKMASAVGQQFSDMDKFPSPVMMIDKEYNITFMNKLGAEVVGKDKKSVIGKKCYEQFKTDHCQTENCALHKAMKTLETHTAQTTARPNGKEMPILYSGAPRIDKDGNLLGAMEFVTDMTEAKEREKYLDRSTKVLRAEMDKFSKGDLTVYAQPEIEDDDIGKLFKGFNNAVENIKNMLKKVSEAVHATASASAQISSSSEEMAAGAQEQSAQTAEIASAVEQMTRTILQTTQNAGTAAEQAKKSGTAAQEGGKVIIQTISGMNRIAEVVKEAAVTVQELGANSEQIGSIIQVIDDIADQTNLLALNAAIEAARAGEQGRGFAVVADEVRKLAERTTKATKEIEGMIKKIQSDTGGAVQSIERGTQEVEKGIQLAEKSNKSLDEIIVSANGVVDVINQVASASEEQSSTSEQISKSIDGISSVAHQSADGVQQIARASEDLNNLTINLQSLIEQFNIGNQNQKNENSTSTSNNGNGRLTVRSNGVLISED